jgi:hypothetical protein
MLRSKKLTLPELAAQLERTQRDVHKRCTALGLYRPLRWWSAEEERMLRKLCGVKTYAEIAEILGRNVASVRHHASELHLAALPPQSWSARDRRRLRDLYATRTYDELAVLLGRTAAAVKSQARRMGLTGDGE